MALTLADLLIEGSLAGGPIAAPPTGPGGLCLVAPSGMSGAFVGKEGQLAGWTAAGRRFVVLIEGARLTIRCGRRGSGSTFMTARGGPGAVRADELVNGGCAWLEAPSRIADPVGGATVEQCSGEGGANSRRAAWAWVDPDLNSPVTRGAWLGVRIADAAFAQQLLSFANGP